MADRSISWRPLWKAGATYVKGLIIPNAAGTIAGVQNNEIWIDTIAGRLNARIAGATVQIPISTDIQAAGMTQEQVEDLLGTLLGADTGDLDWTYTDNGAGAGSFSVSVKADAITYAKIQNVSATSRVLGRITAGAGDIEEL